MMSAGLYMTIKLIFLKCRFQGSIHKRIISYSIVIILAISLAGCASTDPFKGIKARAYETRVYMANYDDTWEAVMTFFQDINVMPTFTDKETGLIKAEVPFTDFKIKKKVGVTATAAVLAGPCAILTIPYWFSTDKSNRIFTAYVKPLSETTTSVRLLAITASGNVIWREKNYPVVHNRIQENITQAYFLEGTGTQIE